MLSSTVEAQLPQIDSLSSDLLTRSGRLRIFGTNFGSGGGTSQVLIDGQNAIVTRWSSSQITAYVPELAGPGSVTVQVVTLGGSSNVVPLAVTLRQLQGRIKWTFEADVLSLGFRPALAPDGTIYVHGSEGFVFAITPDGGLKWIHQVNWSPYVPPHAGSDGEIYVGSIQRITAINPNGTERWQFIDNSAQGISVSAKPGPDGNIYAANDLGLGAYSLTTGGQLRWNNPGNPILVWHGGTGAEMVFGPSIQGGSINQMYVVMNPQGQSMLQAFRLSDGQLQFSVPTGGRDPVNQDQTQPAVGPDGTIYITHLRGGGGIGWTLEAFNPINGQSMWHHNAWNTSGFSPPDVGPDGIVYYVASGSRLVSFDPATLSERWNRFDATLLDYPTVSPNNDMIVLGGAITFGQQGFVRAYDTNGELLWEVPMPGTSLPRWWPVHHPRFTNDGETVYISTSMLDSNPPDPHSFLFAIATGPDSTIDVELISFIATVNINTVSLNWLTATETNNHGFEIQKKKLEVRSQSEGLLTEETEWGLVGFVNGNGTTTETSAYSFTDEVTSGKYLYRLKQIDFDGAFEYSNEIEVEVSPLTEFSLEQNFPNPFNPTTTINYQIIKNDFVSLKVYDILGNEVATLVNEEKPAGSYEINFNASSLSSGIYFFKLQAGSFIETKKMLLLK